MLELNKIYLGDCLEVMEKIDNKSISLDIIDSPYNIGIADWDKITNYIEWMLLVFKECERTLKDNGSLYWFHNDMPQAIRLMKVIEDNTLLKFKQMIVWDKFNGTPNGYKGKNAKYNNQKNYAKCAEYCFFYTFDESFIKVKNYLSSERKNIKESLTWINKNLLGYTNGKDGMAGNILSVNKKGWSFPTKEQYTKLQSSGYFKKDYEKLNNEYEIAKCTFNNINVPSVWQFPPEPPNGHITPKPLKLIDRIINTSSNEGDTILDCFMGSGTTGLSSLKNKRNFIGIEKNEQYYNLACDRIEKFKIS